MANVLSAARRFSWRPKGSGALRTKRKRGGFWFGVIVLTLILLGAIFAPLIAPHDPYAQDILNRRALPFWHAWSSGAEVDFTHPFGTDNVGRDYLSRLIYGARISLTVGFIAALLSTFIGLLIGVSAGYWGGKVDFAANFLIQTRLSVPIILVALAAVASFGGSLQMIVLIAGCLLWDRAAIVARTVTRQIAARDYVRAARALGASDLQIIIGEILPNLATSLLVVTTVEMGHAILLEASLSFLGLGIPPPAPSWGLMLSEAKEDIFFSPWAITIPGVALFLLVVSTSLISDGIRAGKNI